MSLHSLAHVAASHLRKSRNVLRGVNSNSDMSSSVSVSRRTKVKGTRSKFAEEKFKLSHMIFDGDIRVRIMDVDRFRLDELHQYFMYTLVRRFPAEQCVRVASRVALFRDKYSQHSFESMSKDVAAIFGPVYGPELTALFSRCYGTIPVAYMLDYTRRFGKFSRKFIAQEVDKTMQPRAFDFVRYAGGVKPLPGFVARPFSLRSFARMLPPCAAKRYIFQHLLARSGSEKVLDDIHKQDEETTAMLLAKFSNPGIMDPQLPSVARIAERASHKKRLPVRPNSLARIDTDAHSRQPTSPDDIVRAIEGSWEDVDGRDDPATPFATQFTQVQAFKAPRMEDSRDLATLNAGMNSDELSEEVSFGQDDDHPSWWKERQTSTNFFRHNKKAYRLLPSEGWKEVADPRGAHPDYSKSRSLRESRKSVRVHYARLDRRKQRQEITSRTLANRLNRK